MALDLKGGMVDIITVKGVATSTSNGTGVAAGDVTSTSNGTDAVISTSTGGYTWTTIALSVTAAFLGSSPSLISPINPSGSYSSYPFVSNPTSSSPDHIFPIFSPTDTTYPISPPVSPSLNADSLDSPIPTKDQLPHNFSSPSSSSTSKSFPSSAIPASFQSPHIGHSSRNNTTSRPHSPRRNSHDHILTPPVPRRSSRETQWPRHFKDYSCNNIFLTQFTDSCLAQPAKPNSISKVQEPVNYSQAFMHLGWQKAMYSEIAALQENHTWDVVLLPKGKKALP
uniref:Flocculation protein FLO11-like n=1 Tax=Nicotiana tabacum TaxID=4097 RepID=A0A1S4AJ59_TOBAC|nr:PREDICTED: flocculation protein FLO11-like [Nicotiana tabacum]